MSAYRIKDLLGCLHELFRSGCEYVELHNTDPAALSLSGLTNGGAETVRQTLTSCQPCGGNDSESDDNICYEIQFTYDEIATIASALANMPSIYNKAINDENYDPREREAFRTMADKMLRLKEKMEQAF